MVCSRYPKECRYYETVLKKKCFRKLKINVWERKTKWILLEKADYHYRLKLLYKHFNSWLAYLNECFKKKINDRAAEVFHEEKLKSRGLVALKRNVEESRILQRICQKKFECNLKHRCWHQWKHYTQKRVKVREIKLLADRIRRERLRVRCFYLWSFRLREKRCLENAYRKAIAMHNVKLKEKYFHSWKVFTEKKLCEARIEKLAKNCYEDKLKEKFIRFWKRYTLQKKRYKYHIKVIHKFYENYLIKNYLSQWQTAYEKLKLERKIQRNNLAESHYNRKLLEKCFISLWKILEKRKEREEKTEKFQQTITKIYLDYYLNLWQEIRRKKLVFDHLQNKAIQWRENYLRESYLTKIYDKYQEKLEEKEQTANVIKYYNAIIIDRAFRGWLEVKDKKITKQIKLDNANSFYFEKLIGKTFDKWKEFTLMKHRKKMAIEYYKNVLLSRALTGWRIFLTELKTKLSEAKNFEERINAKVMRNAFDIWRNETQNFNSKMEIAVNFHEKSKLKKVFNTWRENSRRKAIYKNRYNRNIIILNNIIIKNALFRWYEMHSLKLNLNRKLEGFKLKLDKKLMGIQFSIWWKFVKKMKSVRENVGNYPQIKSNIIIEEYLVILSGALKEKKVLRRKNELAMKAEDKMLKRKYLRKWLSFICWRREKTVKCMADNRKNESKTDFGFCVSVGKNKRRQPVIPDFLKTHFNNDLIEECQTFRVEEPVNKKLPVFGQSDSFVFFDV